MSLARQTAGREMSAMANPALYALGFLCDTAALHFSDAVIGLQARERLARWTPAGCAMMALAGVWMPS